MVTEELISDVDKDNVLKLEGVVTNPCDELSEGPEEAEIVPLE